MILLSEEGKNTGYSTITMLDVPVSGNGLRRRKSEIK
jgi:hypothetical protein